MTSPLKKAVLKSSMIILLALALSRVFGYLFHALLAKSFDTADYGLFVYLWSLSMMISGLGYLGVPLAVSRFIAFSRGEGGGANARDYLRTGLVLTLALAVLSILFTVAIVKSSLLKIDDVSLAFVCVIILIQGVGFYLGSVLSGFRKPEVSNMSVAFGQIAKVAVLFAVVYFAAGFSWALLSFAAGFALSYLPITIYVWRKYSFAGRFRPDLARELVGFGVFTVFVDTANNLLSWASIFLLQYFVGYSMVAVFNAASLISTAGLVLFLSVIEVYAPVVTELLGRRDYGRCSRLSSYLFESFFMFFLPPFVIIFLFSDYVLGVFFTPAYVQAALSLRILLASSFVMGVAMLFRRFIVADGRPSDDTRIIVTSVVVNVFLNVLLIERYGIGGASFAALVSSVVMLALSLRYLGDRIRVSFSKRRMLKVLGFTGISSLVTYSASLFLSSPAVSLVVLTVLYCAVYSILLLGFRVLREEDVEMVEMVSERIPLPAGVKRSLVRLLRAGVGV